MMRYIASVAVLVGVAAVAIALLAIGLARPPSSVGLAADVTVTLLVLAAVAVVALVRARARRRAPLLRVSRRASAAWRSPRREHRRDAAVRVAFRDVFDDLDDRTLDANVR